MTTRRLLLIVLAGLSGGWLANDCRAQMALNGGLDRYLSSAAPERAELVKQLEKEAEALDARSRVSKLIVKLTGPSVVHLASDASPSRQSSSGFRRRSGDEGGSGVILEWRGRFYVLTLRHVIAAVPAARLRVEFDDRRFLIPLQRWDDAETDVAVLAIPGRDLPAARLGNSDQVEIGDWALAMGSPFGLPRSVTSGIISGKGRRDLAASATGIRFQDFLQTDAAINPGNSGGPLLNARGEVIGINAGMVTKSGGSEGVGFAVPINMFMAVARQLIERGAVRRALLGVLLTDDFSPAVAADLGLPRPVGALVTGITPGSPAEAAGLRPGDVILEFNQTFVQSEAHLITLVGTTEAGGRVPLVILRDRVVRRLPIELRESSPLDVTPTAFAGQSALSPGGE